MRTRRGRTLSADARSKAFIAPMPFAASPWKCTLRRASTRSGSMDTWAAPFVAPVPYAWGWGIGTPWFGFYGGYFAPYPVYASPAFWLTDYLISQSLAAEYQAQMAAQAAANPPPPRGVPQGQVALTPDVKQAIADEVRRQMALENAEAQSQRVEQRSQSRLQRNRAHVLRQQVARFRGRRRSGFGRCRRAGVRGQPRRRASTYPAASSERRVSPLWW